jgi:hypothetical protein
MKISAYSFVFSIRGREEEKSSILFPELCKGNRAMSSIPVNE